jgi:hypothetical protein
MNCTTCDTPLESGLLFCPNCGARVAPASSAAVPTIVLPPGAGEPQPTASQPYPPQSATPQSYTPEPYMPPSIPQQSTFTVTSPPNSGAATVSLIFGILAYIFLPFIGAIIAVIAGHMARNEIRASGGRLGGNGLATAGLVLGYVQIALLVLFACAVVAIGVLAAIGAQSS